MEDQLFEQTSENAYDKASLISKLCFIWASEPVIKSIRGIDISSDKFNRTPKSLQAEGPSRHLQKKWELQENTGKPQKLLWILCKLYSKEVIVCSSLQFFKFAILNVAQLVLIRLLLTSFSVEKVNEHVLFQRYLAAGLMLVIITISPFFAIHNFAIPEHVAAKLQIAITSLVYQKLLRISTAEMQRMNIGQLINIFASDVGRLGLMAQTLCGRLLDPLTLTVYIVFIQLTVGLAGLIGFCAVLAIAISFLHFARFFKSLSNKKVQLVDKRLKLTRELITEARTMKLQCWEKPYCDSIMEIRNKELKICFYNYCYKIMFRALGGVATPIGLLIILYLMLAFGTPITSQGIYPCLTVLNSAQFLIIIMASRVLEAGAAALVSVNRIEDILRLQECGQQKNSQYKGPTLLKHVSCGWDPILNPQDEDRFMFRNIDLTFPKQTVTMVTGPVASGKSTLLLTIANEMYVHNGEIWPGGSFTYLPQEPWLFPATIRQNILFGLPFDESRYQDTLNSCALLQDFSQFPNGDFSKVDDKGLTLSGGQKARIALARALYRQSDIYLLDDPLSAVDVKVGRHIWENCFHKTKNTVILVSHSLQFLNNESSVVYIEKGIVSSGSLKEFREQLNLCIPPDTVDETAEIPLENAMELNKAANESDINDLILQTLHSKKITENNLLLYCKMASNIWNGWGVLLLILFLLACAQAANTTYNISFIGVIYAHSSTQKGMYRTVVPLSYLGYLILIETVLRVVLYFVYFYLCMRASKRLHEQMLHSVIKTHLVFFDRHYTGQIINRFSKDVEVIDDIVPVTIFELLRALWVLVGLLINASYSNVIVVAPIVACLIFLVFMIRMYEKVAHILKAKEASARGPIYTYMNCSINGMAVIRSHENQAKMIQEFHSKQNLHSAIWFIYSGINQFKGLINEFIGIVIIVSVIVVALALPTSTNNSKLGMAISSILVFGTFISMAVKFYDECSQSIFSVGRIASYIGLPKEAGYEIENVLLSPSWPSKGKIQFRNVSLVYGTSKTAALKNINFTIQPGEKVGIVGRTGAGKTSLVAALFRLTETEGSMEIDDVNVKEIPLSSYRNKLSVIPQNPVILSGTVRRNLDPRGEYRDEKMWDVLESVDLKEEVIKMQLGLDDDMGQLSVGQKQLFCLARTLLHQNNIIVLDEATSNVDNKTDQIIQQLIRTKFSSSTILIIAHRLQTVLDLDRIMVMQNGEIVEFDTVEALLNIRNGVFKSMVEKAKLDPLIKIKLWL